MSTVMARGLGRLRIRGSHLSCFYPALGRPVLSIVSLSFFMWVGPLNRACAIWIFLSPLARSTTVVRANRWLMDRWACAARAVPIQFSSRSGSQHPCADAILGLFYDVVPQLVEYHGSVAGANSPVGLWDVCKAVYWTSTSCCAALLPPSAHHLEAVRDMDDYGKSYSILKLYHSVFH